MPLASPCGLAVDWLRSCSKGSWRFYAQDPAVVTKGRFYFMPDDADHLDVPHLFGSATWRGGDPTYPNQLGHDLSLGTHWTNGFRGVPIPPAQKLGTPEDFDVMTIPPTPDTRRTVGGIPEACWTQIGDSPDRPFIMGLEECSLQVAMVKCIALTYDNDPAKLQLFAKAWLGDNCQVTYTPVMGTFPAMTLFVRPDLTVAISSGTDNFQQLALQAFESLKAPKNYGAFGTLPLWYGAASYLNNLLTAAGANPNGPILLTGHSYGGALTTILACQYKLGNPNRQIALMTFGCPKYGDVRLQNIVDTINHLHIANQGDIIPYVPPGTIQMEQFLPIVPLLVRPGLVAWRGPRTIQDVRPDGSIAYIEGRSLDYGTMKQLLLTALAGAPFLNVAAHDYNEYLRRLRIRCQQDDCGVIPDPAWKILWDLPEGELILDDQAAVPLKELDLVFEDPIRVIKKRELIFEDSPFPRGDLVFEDYDKARFNDLVFDDIHALSPFVFEDAPIKVTGSTDCMHPVPVSAGVFYSMTMTIFTQYFFNVGSFVTAGTKVRLTISCDTGTCEFFLYDSATACVEVGQTFATWPTATSIERTYTGFGTDFSSAIGSGLSTATAALFRWDVLP